MPATGVELGLDIECVGDHGFVWATVSGLRNLANALARRFMTPRGGLFYDPDYGLDLRSYLLAGLTDARVSELVAAIEAECLKDERVQDAEVTVTFLRSSGRLNVALDLLTADGPFRLVLGVDEVTVSILNDGLPVLDIGATPPIAETIVVQVQGPQGPAGPAGPAGPSGGGGSAAKVLDDDGEYLTSTGAEELLVQWPAAFADFPAGNLRADFVVNAKVAGGATATLRLYIGGNDSAIDGTLIATIVTTSSGYTRLSTSNASFANPGTNQYVKVTAQTSTVGQPAALKGTSVEIEPA